ncbi:histidinol-phosphate transaminase [Luteithermobacter gelatinilyticus]|uniref:histidinol-phosphate transaminase n=1 Tax=Luteithermobacter gelatinilyticus TaxID=2582913 RepID=UPI001106B4D6|nr:histidinol-phosphate transaminase [Luteithermobacter gelatinilyticus]
MTKPSPNPGLLKISPYVQGQSQLDGIQNPIKLSSNESPLGPSPAAIKAYMEAANTLYRYPDGSQTALREALAERFDLDADKVICGNGSDELIQMLIRAYVARGDEVILSEYAFAMCRIHALAQGAEVITAPEPELVPNVDQILAKVSDKTRLVAIATPNNPAGRYLPASELQRLHDNLPGDIILLVDSAYADYVEKEDYDPGQTLAETTDNVVMTRTFSKLYGLSALRIGWAYASAEIIGMMQRIRTPFNTNAPAMAAACAAVLDRDHENKVRQANNKWLALMSERLTEMGLEVVPSVANFILMRFPETDSHNAGAAWKFLLSRGIIPRPVGAGGPENCLRITIGLDHENRAVLDALQDFMTGV